MSFQIKNKTILLSLLYIFSISLFAQIPAGYYSAAEGKSNKDLKTSLYSIIKVGNRLSYGSGSGSTWSGFEKSDLHPEGYVWDMYSTVKRYFPGNGGVPSGMNIEHSVAKSWWGGSSNDAYKDLYHLNPSDISANSARGSYPLGINSGATFNNGIIKVGYNTFGTEYTEICFEPLDEYKGDFARAYLYMFTCYENYSWTGTSAPTMIVANQTWPMLKTWAKDLLLQWSRQDPVSSKEQNRASEIYKIQNNRNPYIDHPELAEFIWGNKIGQLWSETQSVYPTLVNPKNASIVDFGSVAYMQSANNNVQVLATNLTGDLTLTLTGNNAANFALSTYTITKAQAEAGYMLNVTFNALTLGAQTANIVITGGGISATTVTLNALSTDDFLALPATYITSNGFNANWTASATATGYLLDVYSKIISGNGVKQTILEADFNGSIPSGWTVTGYTDVVTNGYLRLASGSNPGEINTPSVDLSTSGKKLVVKAKQYNTDTNAELTVKVDGQELVVWITTAIVQDFTVDLPVAKVNSIISLSAIKNMRVYVDNFLVETLGSTVSKVSVTGYPANVGNVLTYMVDNLESNATYYYKVSPVGNSSSTSTEIQVTTAITTANKNLNVNNTISYYTTSDGVYITQLPSNAVISVHNLLGNQLYKVQTNTSDIELKLPQKGIYVLQVINNNEQRVFKVRY